MSTRALRFLSAASLREVLLSRLYVLGLGYFLSEATAYRLFESMLRLHNYRRAAEILSIAAQCFPRGEDVQSMRCTLTIRDGDLNCGLPLLLDRLERGDRRAAERLLFRTGSRPRELGQCMQVLAVLADSSLLDHCHRCYALIAQAYLALRSGDPSQAPDLHRLIREQIRVTSALPSVYACPERNRSNITKLLISLHTAAYHLCLQGRDFDGCTVLWREVLSHARNIDYRSLNADAGLRMASNLCRCLALGALVERDGQQVDPVVVNEQDWSDPLRRSLKAMEGVRSNVLHHCLGDQVNPCARSPQENHLEVMQALQEACRDLLGLDPARRSWARRHYARFLNHSSDRNLAEVIQERLNSLDSLPAPAEGRPGVGA